jgi:hypothetical protein
MLFTIYILFSKGEMSMRKLLAASLLIAAVASPAVFGQDSGSVSIRVDGGWNTWVLGNAATTESTVSGVTASGFAVGADVLFGDKTGLQYGLGAAYLPMFSASIDGQNASLQMVPVVAELFFNGSGAFYGDLGIGVAFLSATSNANEIDSSSTSSFAPSPGLLAKVGLGWNIPVNDLIGIDLGTDLYLPFTDFGLGTGINSPVVDMIAFSQFNLKFGVVFNL